MSRHRTTVDKLVPDFASLHPGYEVAWTL